MLFFDEDSNARYYSIEAGTMLPADLDHIVDDLLDTDVKDMVIGTAIAPGTSDPDAWAKDFEMEKGLNQPWFSAGASRSSYRIAANRKVFYRMGIDTSTYLLQRAKAAGLKTWITVRLNDQHNTWLESYPARPKIWLEHPELRTKSCFPQSGFSHEHAAVREIYYNLINDNLRIYDADGIVLDWMRHVPHFNDGEGESFIPVINDYMASIKKLVDSYAAQRGHRIEIAVRIPVSVESARYHGLDGAAWAQKGYVDRLIIAPKYLRSYCLDPSSWKKAIGKDDFPVTACIDTPYQPYPGYPADTPAGTWSREPFDRRQLPFIRGACRIALNNGSDGIYLFNFMNIRDKKQMTEIFHECGSLEKLYGRNFSIDISYDDLDMAEPDFIKGWRAASNDQYFSLWRQQLKNSGCYPYQLPQELCPGASCQFRFLTGPVTEKELPAIAFSFEGLGDAEVMFNGKKCDFADGRFLAQSEHYTGDSAVVTVKNLSAETVEIQRASMHFSWDGKFPELYDHTKKLAIGVAVDI